MAITLAALAPTGVVAQAAVLDEGRFTLFVDGREAGSETFRIQRTGTGDEVRIVGSATVHLERTDGTHDLVPIIETGPDLTPVRYSNKMSGAQTAEVSGRADGGRFVVRVTSEEGESQREFRAGPGTVVLERDVASLYYFTARLVEQAGGTITAILPGSGEQLRLRVASSEVEPFRYGRETLEVRHVRLEAGAEIHDLWLDDQGRVLRVEVSSRNYRAERDPA
jgi:hypothetical protein